ncbi:MAG: GH1 family beta-glucosidase [Marinilabiliales bacterium]|nr:GH1 family beta-glucosidase [Marinilabiliales bacterium]
MIRSEFIKSLAALTVAHKLYPLFSPLRSPGELTKNQFGKDFIWGVGTSAYQSEGAAHEEGKGPSIWDTFSESSGHIKDHSNGLLASDFYHRYREDLQLARTLNFKNFRFSFSWARILPEGKGTLNPKGIDFYNRVLDTTLEMGMEPWGMLYHWDLPQALEEQGGWTNRDVIGWFSEYADLASRKFGDRLKHWMVLNEPTGFTTLGYLSGIHAPGRIGIGSFLSAVHHAAMCQAEGGRILRQNVKGSHIGNALSCSWIEPGKMTESHLLAAKRLDAIINRLFIEPSLGMGYPTADLPLLERIEQYVKNDDLQKLPFDFDFIGLQNYFRIVTKPSIIPFIWANRVKPDEGAELTEMGWEVYPEGIYRIIMQFSKYPIREIILTENGAAYPDMPENGHIHDHQRIYFFQRYLQNILKAKNQGAKVNGYFVWTLIDNFEWAEGLRPRFGLVYNEFETQKRIIKDSGYWFREFLR